MNEILVDNREPPEFIRTGRDFFPNLNVKKIDIGDVVYKNLVIERKDIWDFVQSIHNQRIFRQASRMRMEFPYRFIFLVGNVNELFADKVSWDKRQNVNESSFYAAVASLTVKYECPVISVNNSNNFWQMFAYFVEKMDDNKPLKASSRPVERGLSPTANAIRAAVEGIGPKKAEKIAEFFDIHTLCEINEREVQKVPGIGVKQAKAIKEVFK